MHLPPKNNYLSPRCWFNYLCCILLLIFASAQALALEPRLFLWGLAGTEEIGRLDFLVPFYTDNTNFLFYTDLQGEVDPETNWYTGVGVGVRNRVRNRIWGGYIFLDRNFTQHHNAYYILNPGVETLGCQCDFRVNGYFPVSKKLITQHDIPNLADTCGDNANCEQTFFEGHQQFLQTFITLEEAGSGFDAEIGKHFGANRPISLYGGVYYFQLPETKNVTGIESRMIFPIRKAIAITAEASYDNVQHGAFLIGLRLQGGHEPHEPMCLTDRLYDPVTRNLGALQNGLSVPIVRAEQLSDVLLIRDNIYFFSHHNGTAFGGEGTGTFEKPLSRDQFLQTTVDGIAQLTPEANLFFNPGDYVINPSDPNAPNANILLHDAQSIFGRSEDYRCAAQADERPVFFGALSLLEGHNHLDSIQVLNEQVINAAAIAVNFNALEIEAAPNVSICNSNVTARLEFNGNSDQTFLVSGMSANNSAVTINTSRIAALIEFNGNTLTGNTLTSTVGIGHQNFATTQNQIIINESEIISASIVNGQGGTNLATGIGNNVATALSANFANNNFNINETAITSTATATSMLSPVGISNSTMASAIGNNLTSSDPQINNSVAHFQNNTFNLNNASLTTRVTVAQGGSTVSVVGIGNNIFGQQAALFANNNFAIADSMIAARMTRTVSNNAFIATTLVSGIGDNASELGDASFQDNHFSLSNTQINGAADTSLTGNLATNLVTSVGCNSVTGAAIANFVNNIVRIQDSLLSSAANMQGNNSLANFATVIGGNTLAGTAQFSQDDFQVTNSILNSQAVVNGDNQNNALNYAAGVGGNAPLPSTGAQLLNTDIKLEACHLEVLAQILGSNLLTGQNIATGLRGDAGSLINFTDSNGLARALVGVNLGTNLAQANDTSTAGVYTFSGSTFTPPPA